MGRIIQHIRQLRRNATPQETKLWGALRNHQTLGYTFRRQHIVHYIITPQGTSYFVADFCCVSLKLIVEVDGAIHDHQKDYDLQRQKILEAKGYTIFRCSNDDVENCFGETVKKIEAEVLRLKLLRNP